MDSENQKSDHLTSATTRTIPPALSGSLAYDAMMFAREVHKDQTRKYTGNPYTDHLAEVCGIVATVAHEFMGHHLDAAYATAWLHDCIEDQGVSYGDLYFQFGALVADGVQALSDTEQGSRTTRKALARSRLAGAPPWVQTIKCADLISNTASIVQHDPKFAVTYLEEKRLLLDVLTKADPRLLKLAREQAGPIAGPRTESDPK